MSLLIAFLVWNVASTSIDASECLTLE
uniref:Uncharacterized protein n=1 Tax=Rhizophora mucronata TaxID=61149 RepID=A0A2P2QFE4_RHIMU